MTAKKRRQRKMLQKSPRSQPPVPATGLKFLTRKEAARELRVSLATLDRMIGRGQLKAKKHGHSTFVMATEVERYINELPDLQPRASGDAR
ncbi:helix-turn-helix domain-containing protein [Bradyrhizobium sp. SRL28]|uniref:helix-turn-helix domain-containing protein n=1 Tax=Bradyrhizobium sp. SRL28 TaxID=2836178 RepID=UPI001BDED85F|nr:helix-turn-helix domain-containing protein [Bradyrhizobium sp. SRL28]MBT1509497.1 helix-turn-helix domain-containing protein [Bradyrhizobium sp. SRL28]